MAGQTDPVNLTVDGVEEHGQVEPNRLLVHYLRDQLGSGRVRDGCETGRCGECTILLDGEAAKSCNLFAVQVSGSAVDTLTPAAQKSVLGAGPQVGARRRTGSGVTPVDQAVLPFEYHRPEDLGEAIALLGEFGEDGRLIAGGQGLIPLLKRRLIRVLHLIDIRELGGLSAIRRDRVALVIGGTATHTAIEASDLVRSMLPVLSEVASSVGDRADRNMGTVGGSLAHRTAHADWGTAVITFGADIVVANLQGEKRVPAAEFFRARPNPVLEATDVVTSVRFRLPPPRTGGAYERLSDPDSGFATIGAAALVTLDTEGLVVQARVGLGGLSGSPVRAVAVERRLAGSLPDEPMIEAAAALAVEGLAVDSPPGQPAAQRVEIARGLVEQALRRAVAGASW